MPLSSVLQDSFLGLWQSVIAFLPRFVGALVVLIIGWLIALVLSSVVLHVIKFLRLDELSAKLELKGSFEKAGINLHIGKLLSWIVKWFFIVFALIAATDVLGWAQVTDFLQQVVLFIPNDSFLAAAADYITTPLSAVLGRLSDAWSRVRLKPHGLRPRISWPAFPSGRFIFLPPWQPWCSFRSRRILFKCYLRDWSPC